MAIKDISWGAVIVGAGLVTAMVMAAPASAIGLAAVGSTTSILGALTASSGLGTGAVLGGAAAVGGVAGEFVSDLLKRGRDACATLVRPR